MIQLTLPPEPPELTANRQRLTAAYAESCRAGKPKAVWNTTYIREALLEMTHGKCAYAEVKLKGHGAYWDVEHFKCKKLYPEQVVEWGNLLPACEFCNRSAKGDHDVVAEPIVDPIHDRPSDHLYVRCGRFFSKDAKGRSTIEVLKLNDEVNLLCARFEVCRRCEKSLRECEFWMKRSAAPSDRCAVRNKLLALLRGGLPDREYAATVATCLLYDNGELLREVEAQLRSWQLWDEEMERTKETLRQIALPK